MNYIVLIFSILCAVIGFYCIAAALYLSTTIKEEHNEYYE